MNLSIPPQLKAAYGECGRLAAAHYENFPVASLLLPKPSRPHIAALYAFARTADDYADEEHYEGKRLTLLSRWEKGLIKAFKDQKTPPVLQAFAHTLKVIHIPLSLPLALLKAYRMDLTVKRYADWKSLLHYCRHSAEPVGRMVLYICGIRDEGLHRFSDYVCTGLQLINFWQDTRIDLKRGRIYYPGTELRKAGVREKDLLALRDSPAFRELVRGAVDFTETHFRKGLPLLQAVPGRLRLELKATYLGGEGILNKIRRMDYNVLQNRPLLGSWDKVWLGFRALGGWIFR
jgi:hydroxysqualene synthase